MARAMVGFNPRLKWVETARRGYMTVSLTPGRADAQWPFLETVCERSTAIAARHGMASLRGCNRLV
jgi:alkaline phosphatase D